MTTEQQKVPKQPAMPLEAGQVWKEGDDQFQRHVLIVALDRKPGKATISTCDEKGVSLYGDAVTHAKVERFSNKKSGYIFVGKAKLKP